MNLSELFIRRPVMTVLLTVSVMLFGVFAYTRLPVNDLPAVDYPVITVNVAYPGADPETMANNVATPLERQFMQIPGLELVTSKSGQGNTSFTLQFALDKSLDGAATDVQAAITQAQGSLPADLPAPPTMSKTNPNDQPIMFLALTTNTVTQGQLYDYANTQVGQEISIISGVARVQIFGTKGAVRIKADPSKLAARGMTMDDLAKAIQGGTAYSGAGQFDSANDTLLLKPKGQLDTAEGYNNLIVATEQRRAGLPARRGDGDRRRAGRAHQHALLVARVRVAGVDGGRRRLPPGGRQRRRGDQGDPRQAPQDPPGAAAVGASSRRSTTGR